jgi:hypothetical protein
MSEPRTENALGRWLAIAASVVVVVTVIAAILVMGPPSTQRELRLDQKRVGDLGRIANAARNHAERHGALPKDLATLARQPGQWISFVDPKDGAPYTYEVTGARTFRLCAVFATDTAKTENAGFESGDEWIHGTGRQCFDLRARKK